LIFQAFIVFRVELIEVKMSNKYFDYLKNDVDFMGRLFSFEDAKKILLTGRYFTFGQKNKSSMVIACKSNNFYLYNKDKDQFGVQINFDAFKDFNDWLIMPLPSKCVDTFRNKFIGSSFDNFAKEYNIVVKKDMTWAIKMLHQGKIVYREEFPEVILFPLGLKNNPETLLTVDDLFAEDWMVFNGKNLKEVLDDFYVGKSIRRKSWYSEYVMGKYSKDCELNFEDLNANDWEVVDVVAEVDQIQKDHLKDRNEY
jgi:hypothetical protein